MKVLIIGAGGHARVIADALISRNQLGEDNVVVGFLDDSDTLQDRELLGARILGRISEADKFDHDAVVIGIEDNLTRRSLYTEMKNRGEKLLTVVHPRATLAAGAMVGDGTVIFGGAVVNSGARIGSNVILNPACTVGHDLTVASHAQIGTGVNLGGGVTVGEGASVCMGSAVLQNMTIGNWAVVGPGSAVIHNVIAFETVVGVPAATLQEQFTKNSTDDHNP